MLDKLINKINDWGVEDKDSPGLGNLYDVLELQIQNKSHNYNNIFINKAPTSEYHNKTKVRNNREYLISQEVAHDLNTYTGYNPFWTFTDLYIQELDEHGKEKTEGKLLSSKGVHSIFNKYSAVALAKSSDVENASEWRLSNNVPLMDNRSTRATLKEIGACTIKDLVVASSKGWLGRETYSYSDFMYCKHLGKIPNNYLITLRRFPIPVDDYISKIGSNESTLNDATLKNNNSLSVGCLVTWMGTPGNEMSNLLKYSYNMPFKEQTAQWETPQGGDAQELVGAGKLLNNIAAAFDPTYIKHATAGEAVLPFKNYMEQILGPDSSRNPYDLNSLLTWKDSNKVYGPVDAIKSTYMRSEDGIKFDQDITLTFDYELRAYNGINGRLAMLDLLANILTVTYTTGTFWGGGYRGGGVHLNNIFTNLEMFKTRGGFNEFVDAFAQDYSTVTEGFRNKLEAQGGENWMQNAMSVMKSALNMMGGMLLGGMLNRLGRPLKVFANSLLSPAPVGFWHVTIGNPFHPIMSMGNMILKNTTIEHYGPLGLDDFPTGLKVTCELTRGKPRDLRGIENLYMHGNDRIYSSMGPKIKDMYDSAKEYKSNKSIINDYGSKSRLKINNNRGAERAEIPSNSISQNIKFSADTYKLNTNILMRNFGDTDIRAIELTAKEMEYGASSKKKPAVK